MTERSVVDPGVMTVANLIGEGARCDGLFFALSSQPLPDLFRNRHNAGGCCLLLKGAAGGYGFGPVSDAAAQVEDGLRSGAEPGAVAGAARQLRRLVDRMVAP